MNFSRTDAMDKMPLGNQNNMNNAHFSHQLIAGQPQMYQPNMAGVPNNMNGHFGGMYGNSGIAPGPGFDHLSMAPGVSAPNGQERQDHFLQESTSWSAGASADPLAQFPHQNSSFPYIPTYSNAPVISSSAMGMHCSSAQGTSTSMPMDMNYSSAQGMSSSMPMGMHCSSAQGTSTSMPMGMHCSSALGTSNNMHDPSDDTDIFQIAKQISNDNGNGSSFGYPQTSYNMDEPLLWNALTNFPASSGAGPSGGLDDLGFDFEDISKEQLLPITFTAPSFVSTAEQCIASSMSSLSSSMPSLSLSMPSLSSKYPTSQHSAAMFSPSYPAEPPAYSFAPTPTYPATPAPPAQTAHIDGIKNMFRMLDMPSTSSFLQADGAQPSTSMEQFLPSPDKTNIPCTVVNDSANTVNTADTLETKIEPEPEAEIEETPMKVSKKFQVDKSKLHEVSAENQSSDLAGLGLTVYNQEQLEEDIIGQLDTAIEAEELQKTKMMKQKGLNAVKEDIKSCLAELQKAEKVLDMLQGGKNTMNKDVKRRRISVRNQIDQKLKQLDKLRAKKKSLLKAQNGLDDSKSETTSQAESNAAAVQAMIGLDVDDKIRKGEMTPFGTVMDFDKKKPEKKEPLKVFLTKDSPFDKYLMDQDSRNKKVKASTVSKKSKEPEQKKGKSKTSSKDKNKKAVRDKNDGNFFDAKDKRQYRPSETDFSNHRQSKRSSFSRLSHNFSGDGELSDNECGDEDERYDEHLHNGNEDDDDYIPDELPDSDDKEWTDGDKDAKAKRPKRKKNADFMEDAPPTAKKRKSAPLDKLNCRDDGNFEAYRARIQAFNKANAKKKFDHIEKGEVDSDDDSDVELDGGFTVPGRIWSKLYPFQRTGVRWLWELHGQEAGGIVGDEMGLGKTIQIVGFLAGLAHSNLKDSASKYRGLGPSLIVVPATVMHQWVKEFHKWAPKFRVAILHNTGSYTSSEESLVQNVIKSNGILVTAYSSVVIYQEILLKYNWHYVILDEGHKIRNPDAQVTVAAKQFRTCHRLILSGSPIQNNLKELWSLFDFVFPGKLGTLPDFMAHFSVPIVQGGYSNASQVQVQTAYKCASVLRDTISPYLLRRMKSDVKENLQLPEKNEQVLFCRLTDAQRDVYQEYLDSRECQEILRGNFMVFPGLITLRKICNHPDLSTGGINNFDPDLNSMSEEEKAFGYPGRSGKMLVVQSLLKLWHKQGHRVLLFSQGTQMLNILESQVQAEGYSYMRMDGTTSIGARQTMVDKFNDTPDIFIFLLTTRVGGLGVNLCGANRVLLFDPDWNPSTDTQARERAWRIGQSRQVTIYRLLTTGTIEEKIYHRQIFKQFLTNRVLKDPKQRRFFKSNDLFELFTLSSDDPKHGTETGAIFAGTGSEVAVKPKKKEKKVSGKRNRFDEMKVSGDNRNLEIDCDEEEKKSKEVQERLEKMRELARKISQKMEKEKQELAKGKDGGAEGGAAEDIKEKIKLEEGEIEESEDTMPSTSQCASPLESCKSESSTKSKHRKHHHKDKKSSKRHHKRRKDVKFEGETISHLAKHSTYKTVEDENQSDKKDDDDVLQSLFKRSGVHSALQHDTIMMSSNPDFALVEGEAERVAKEAAAALKRSRARCYSARAGIPTWTGQSGKTVASNAPPKPRFGQKKNSLIVGSSKPKEEPKAVKPKPEKPEKPEKEKEPNLFDGTIAGNVKTNVTGSASLTVMSSSELMNRMKKRNHHSAPSTSTSLGQDPDDDQYAPQVTEETMEFITDIRHFIAFQSNVNGQATTQELLDEFSAKIPSKDSAQFKAMLKEICVFRKVDGVGMWKLRPEFW